MVNRKAIHDNVEICRDLINETEKLLEQALVDCVDHSYLNDLIRICLSNIASLTMKLEVASNITDSIE